MPFPLRAAQPPAGQQSALAALGITQPPLSSVLGLLSEFTESVQDLCRRLGASCMSVDEYVAKIGVLEAVVTQAILGRAVHWVLCIAYTCCWGINCLQPVWCSACMP
jgi:hypothetical protein